MATSTKSPAFQFYAAEWLADEHVRLMTLEQTGAYIDALAICWREGSIPADPVLLARLIGKGCSVEVATYVQLRFNISCTGECFPVERLQHKRLNAERAKQELRSRQMSLAGKKSAANKKQKPSNKRLRKSGNLGSTQVQPKHNSSSSSSDEDVSQKTTIPPMLQDVVAYCESRSSSIDPAKFVNYYDANGWRIGRNKMKDWQAAVRSWEQNEKTNSKPSKPGFFDGLKDYMGGEGS